MISITFVSTLNVYYAHTHTFIMCRSKNIFINGPIRYYCNINVIMNVWMCRLTIFEYVTRGVILIFVIMILYLNENSKK